MADRYEHGMAEVLDADDRLVARAIWITDPYKGDWEWQIVEGGPATRRRLDEMFEANQRLTALDFRAFSSRPAPGWESFEGLVGCLHRCLPGFGFQIGEVVWPPEIARNIGDADCLEDARIEGEAAEAAAFEQDLRATKLAGWAASGEPMPEVGPPESTPAVAEPALETEV